MIARGTVWTFAPEMNNSGPRSGLSVSTSASVHGLTFATAASNSGAPGAAAVLHAWYGLRLSNGKRGLHERRVGQRLRVVAEVGSSRGVHLF